MAETPLADTDVERVAASLAHFSISFLAFALRDGQEYDGLAAGSGVLVKTGPIYGILTAAHVLQNLPRRRVGLVRIGREGVTQALATDVQEADIQLIGGEENKDGPDLGFLALPASCVSALLSTNSFFDLTAQEHNYQQSLGQRPYLDATMGALGERVHDLPPMNPFHRRKNVESLFATGRTIRRRTTNGFDLIDLLPSYEPNTQPPASYGGMSGGPLWRVFMAPDGKGGYVMTGKIIMGIAFRESEETGAERRIICHGPASIYEKLLPAIRAKWPHSFERPLAS
jgi:hypothetical protein